MSRRSWSLVLLIVALSSKMWAQNENAGATQVTDRSEKVTLNDDVFRVETAGIKSNWFVGTGAGTQTYFGDHDKQLYWNDRITPAVQMQGGKWLSPGFGLRVNVSGYELRGATHKKQWSNLFGYAHKYVSQEYIDDGKIDPQTGLITNDYVKPDGQGLLYYQRWNYVQGHVDMLFNLNNMFGGYRFGRVWNTVPYVGLGWMHAFSSKTEKTAADRDCNQEGNNGLTEIGATLGWLNTFEIGNGWSMTFDVYGTMVNDRFDGDYNPGYKKNQRARINEGALTFTAGVQYNFSPRGWQKIRNVVVTENRTVRETRRERRQNRNPQPEAKNTTVYVERVDTAYFDIGKAAPVLVTFEIDKIDLSKKNRVNLGFFAEVIKQGDKNVIYTITGYADRGTGSVKRNQWLSENRAKAVYDCLTQEYGVPKEQLRVDYKGGVENMFYDDPQLSRAVITRGDYMEKMVDEQKVESGNDKR